MIKTVRRTFIAAVILLSFQVRAHEDWEDPVRSQRSQSCDAHMTRQGNAVFTNALRESLRSAGLKRDGEGLLVIGLHDEKRGFEASIEKLNFRAASAGPGTSALGREEFISVPMGLKILSVLQQDTLFSALAHEIAHTGTKYLVYKFANVAADKQNPHRGVLTIDQPFGSSLEAREGFPRSFIQSTIKEALEKSAVYESHPRRKSLVYHLEVLYKSTPKGWFPSVTTSLTKGSSSHLTDIGLARNRNFIEALKLIAQDHVFEFSWVITQDDHSLAVGDFSILRRHGPSYGSKWL